MKKYISILALTIILAPSIALASWWNPFTWSFKNFFFKKTAPIENIEKTHEIVTINTPLQATTSVSSETKVSSQIDASSEIEKLKKEVEVLKNNNQVVHQKTESTEIIHKKPQPPVAPAKTMDSAPVVASITQSTTNQCLSVKKDWGTFVVAIRSLDEKFLEAQNYFASENGPSELIPKFTYNFNRMTSDKGRFISKTEEIRKIVESLKKPLISSDVDFEALKDTYLNSVIDTEKSYDMSVQAWRVVAEDKDGIGDNDISIAQAFLRDSQAENNKISTERAQRTSLLDKFTRDLFNDKTNGCIFTFLKDGTIDKAEPR